MKKIIKILATNKKLVVAIVTAVIGIAGLSGGSPLVEPVVTIGLEIAQVLAS